MLIAAMKVVFDEDCYPAKDWTRGATSLCVKLQSRYKVLAKPEHKQSELAIIAVCLVADEHKGDVLFDKILESCETYGLGRVVDDERIMEECQEIFNPRALMDK
ncbi:MAG: hypothetical protein AB8G05_01755 [Oligoflexales bacterium]